MFARLGAPVAIVLVRDADSQPHRLTGLTQARDDLRHGVDPLRVAIGVADPEREAWHLCGFEPRSKNEQHALEAERRRLGFDPTTRPERLGGDGKRNAKPVLAKLTDARPEREHRCLDVPLDQLRTRGARCGLDAFSTELNERIVPVFTNRSAE